MAVDDGEEHGILAALASGPQPRLRTPAQLVTSEITSVAEVASAFGVNEATLWHRATW